MLTTTQNLFTKWKSIQSTGCCKFRTDKKLGKYERYITLGKCNIWLVKKHKRTNYFAFSFTTLNLNDLLSFQLYLLDSENKKIEFNDDEKKNSILNFKTEVLQ